MGYRTLPSGNLRRLTELSRYVSEIANMPHYNHQPYVGHGAFAHKGGIHVSAMLKDSLTYEHVNPEDEAITAECWFLSCQAYPTSCTKPRN